MLQFAYETDNNNKFNIGCFSCCCRKIFCFVTMTAVAVRTNSDIQGHLLFGIVSRSVSIDVHCEREKNGTVKVFLAVFLLNFDRFSVF